MTRFISRLLFFWVVISSLSINAECKNRALLIGIGDYPSDSGWRKLSSENDVVLLGELLKDDFEVVRLLNSSASHDGIIKALVRLENSVQKGDTIFVLLSGHGQLMEPVADGKELDEAFIPYDAAKAFSNKYKGDRHLRDKELSKHVDVLRTKAGPKGLVVIAVDACHSGGMERDVVDKPYVIRGTSDIFGPSDEEKKYELLSYNLRNDAIDKIQKTKNETIQLKHFHDTINLPIADIQYVQREGRALSIYTQTMGTITTYESIKQLHYRINRPYFVFIDRGIFINIDYVRRTDHNTITLFNGTALGMSRNRSMDVKQAISKYWHIR